MTVIKQTAIGMTRLSPLVGVAEVALAAAREHAANQYMSALRNLIGQVMLLLGAIALFAGAVLVVTRRVTVPLQKLSEAMRKLAGGDFGVVLPGLERKDEIGAMANAVEEFKVWRTRRPATRPTRPSAASRPRPQCRPRPRPSSAKLVRGAGARPSAQASQSRSRLGQARRAAI